MIPKIKLDSLKIDMQELADIAAMTGQSYFKSAFREKGFDGKKWAKAKIDDAGKRKRGSLMVQSAALMNSVRIVSTSDKKVVWSAGNEKVPYAEVHNTGGKAGRGTGFTMPQRQFMGKSEQLEEKITKRISSYLKTALKGT